MGLLFVFGLCYVLPGIMCYVLLRSMCYVLRGAVVRGSFSCASSPAELWPLSNLPGRVFDGVSCAHHIYYFRLILRTDIRCDNPAKCPRALVRFVVANVACSYCLLLSLIHI